MDNIKENLIQGGGSILFCMSFLFRAVHPQPLRNNNKHDKRSTANHRPHPRLYRHEVACGLLRRHDRLFICISVLDGKKVEVGLTCISPTELYKSPSRDYLWCAVWKTDNALHSPLPSGLDNAPRGWRAAGTRIRKHRQRLTTNSVPQTCRAVCKSCRASTQPHKAELVMCVRRNW